MTSEEIAVMSLAVAQHFGLWKPGQMCNYGDVRCRHLDEPLADTWDELTRGKFKPHEIPCPDLTQPEHFVRLLKESRIPLRFHSKKGAWCADFAPCTHTEANTPEEALLCAAYQLVQREAAK